MSVKSGQLQIALLAEVLTADEALACGFLLRVVKHGESVVNLEKLSERLACASDQSVSKEGLHQLVSHDFPSNEDLVRICCGIDDFREGVQSFVAKRSPAWIGSQDEVPGVVPLA